MKNRFWVNFLGLLFGMPAVLFAQLLDNPSFEDSTVVVGGSIPSGWSVSGFGSSFTSDAHDGQRAVKLWNWYYYGKGWLVNGSTSSLFAGGGMPCTFRTLILDGWYKYDLGLNGGASDSAYCDMLLFRYNTVTGLRDTFAYHRKLLGPASQYTYFYNWVDASDSVAFPDSLVISFASSVSGFCDNLSSGDCLYLTVDDLQLDLPVGLEPAGVQGGKAKVATMVLDGQLNVYLPPSWPENGELRLFDLQGRKMLGCAVSRGQNHQEVGSLTAGLYVWVLMGGDGLIQSGKLLIP